MRTSRTLSSGLPHFFTLLWLLTAAVFVLSGPSLVQSFRGVAHPRAVLTAPQTAEPLPPAAPPFVATFGSAEDFARAADCLAQAIYYEAGVEPETGQRAVAQVVLNRVRDRNFPSTVCGVVYQRAGKGRGVCAFSFVCDGSIRRRPPGEDQWARVRELAVQALNGYVQLEVGTATHYHADYCSPWWRKTVVEVAQIGAHIFYRWPGAAGLPKALMERYTGGDAAVWASLHAVVRLAHHDSGAQRNS